MKRPIVFRLSMSSWAGIVFNASHWYCRVWWKDDAGEEQQADAECGRGIERTSRFDGEVAARTAGLRLARRLAAGRRYIVVEGSGHIDPKKCLSAPGNLKQRLNKLWRSYEKLNGWEAPKEIWSAVQVICDSWSRLIGDNRDVKCVRKRRWAP